MCRIVQNAPLPTRQLELHHADLPGISRSSKWGSMISICPTCAIFGGFFRHEDSNELRFLRSNTKYTFVGANKKQGPLSSFLKRPPISNALKLTIVAVVGVVMYGKIFEPGMRPYPPRVRQDFGGLPRGATPAASPAPPPWPGAGLGGGGSTNGVGARKTQG